MTRSSLDVVLARIKFLSRNRPVGAMRVAVTQLTTIVTECYSILPSVTLGYSTAFPVGCGPRQIRRCGVFGVKVYRYRIVEETCVFIDGSRRVEFKLQAQCARNS